MDKQTTDGRAVVVVLLLIAFSAGSCWGEHQADREAAEKRDQLMEGFHNSITCVEDAHEAMHDETYAALNRGDIEEAKHFALTAWEYVSRTCHEPMPEPYVPFDY